MRHFVPTRRLTRKELAARSRAKTERRERQRADAPVARQEYRDAQNAEREKTARLRALRLARDAAENAGRPDNSGLDEEISGLKEDIKQQMRTVGRLQADSHEYADAEQHLNILLQVYSSLVQEQHFPPRS